MALDFNDASPQGQPDNITEHPTARKARILRAVQLRIREFVRDLFPHATGLKSDTARIGNINGEHGSSLAICLSPMDKAGHWKEFAPGGGARKGGDVFDLYAEAHNLNRSDFPHILDALEQWAGGMPPEVMRQRQAVQQTIAKPAVEIPKTVATFHYLSSTGEKLFDVVRIEFDDETGNPILKDGKRKKIYKPRLPDGSTYTYPPGPRALYRIPDIDQAQHVVLVEGEPCADALNAIGIVATTAPGGSSIRMDSVDWRPLAGKSVTLWPDNDDPGLAYMKNAANHLRSVGCKVRELTPPAGKPEKWDAVDALAEGFDVHTFLAEPAAPKPPNLPILDVSGLLSVPDPTWIIDGWVIDDGVSVFYGPAKTFKTFNVLDMSLSVACGVPWRGNAVTQTPVLYLLGEGMGTFKYRVHVWLQKRSEGRKALFWTIPVGVPLSTPEGLANAIAAIESLPIIPGLIVVDTLNRHFGPGDENSTQDMTKFVQAIDVIRARTRAHICIVHHSGKDAEKGSRGSSALLGAVDNEFRITRTEGTKLCRIECTAARHSDEPKPMTVELVKFDAVHPETGEVMTSLLPVLRSTDEVDLLSQKTGKPLSKSARLILQLLHEGPKFVKELVEETGLKRPTVQLILSELATNKHVYSKEADGSKIWHVLENEATLNV